MDTSKLYPKCSHNLLVISCKNHKAAQTVTSLKTAIASHSTPSMEAYENNDGSSRACFSNKKATARTLISVFCLGSLVGSSLIVLHQILVVRRQTRERESLFGSRKLLFLSKSGEEKTSTETPSSAPSDPPTKTPTQSPTQSPLQSPTDFPAEPCVGGKTVLPNAEVVPCSLAKDQLLEYNITGLAMLSDVECNLVSATNTSARLYMNEENEIPEFDGVNGDCIDLTGELTAEAYCSVSSESETSVYIWVEGVEEGDVTLTCSYDLKETTPPDSCPDGVLENGVEIGTCTLEKNEFDQFSMTGLTPFSDIECNLFSITNTSVRLYMNDENELPGSDGVNGDCIDLADEVTAEAYCSVSTESSGDSVFIWVEGAELVDYTLNCSII